MRASYGPKSGPKAGSRASSPGEQAAACDCQKTRELGSTRELGYWLLVLLLVDVENQALAAVGGADDQVAHSCVTGHHVVDADAVALPVTGVDGFLVELLEVDAPGDFVGVDLGERGGDAANLVALEHPGWPEADVDLAH